VDQNQDQDVMKGVAKASNKLGEFLFEVVCQTRNKLVGVSGAEIANQIALNGSVALMSHVLHISILAHGVNDKEGFWAEINHELLSSITGILAKNLGKSMIYDVSFEEGDHE
jgi:phage-related tail protein